MIGEFSQIEWSYFWSPPLKLKHGQSKTSQDTRGDLMRPRGLRRRHGHHHHPATDLLHLPRDRGSPALPAASTPLVDPDRLERAGPH